MTVDVDAWVAIRNECMPREPVTADEVRRGLERYPTRRLYLRGDEGCAMAGTSALPGAAGIYVYVRPSARRRGVGSALFEEAVSYARTLEGVDALFSKADGGAADAVAFLERRGFEEIGREVELVRPLRADEDDVVAPPGIEIVELTEAHEAAAYAVVVEATPDMAFDPPLEVSPFEVWHDEELTGPVALVALDGDRVVGFASLITQDARPGVLEHGTTCVLRSHRRRGIATALKQACIAWAARNGYRELTTWTQEGNAGMHAVNVAVGFEPQPPWILFKAPLA
jgi:GNAT superfamily N-acetyltransferase